MIARPGLRRVLIVVSSLLAGIVLIALGLRVPSPQLTGAVKSDIVFFSNQERFFIDDLVGRNLLLSFEGKFAFPTGEVLDPAFGFLSIAENERSLRASMIEGFEVPANTDVLLTADEREQRVTLRLIGSSLNLSVYPSEGAVINAEIQDCNALPCGLVPNASPRPFRVISHANSAVQISFDVSEMNASIANQIDVEEFRVHDFETVDGVVYKRSGLAGGRLQFRATPDVIRELHRGEMISIIPQKFRLRSLDKNGDEFTVQLSGSVKDVRGEIAESSYPMKPTLFEAWRRIPELQIVIGIASVLVGAGVGIPRRLKN